MFMMIACYGFTFGKLRKLGNNLVSVISDPYYPSARMRERVTVVTLSVCLSVCHFSILEKAPFSGLKLTSVYILGDDLSP